MSSDAYWDGARRGKLVLQRCARCGRIRHYPRPLCDACYSFDTEHVEADGGGTVHSWTTSHHAFDPTLAEQVPYVLLTVDMVEGVRVLGRWHGSTPPTPGLPVRIGFAPGADDLPVPVFNPVVGPAEG